MLSLTDPAIWARLKPYLDEVLELDPGQRMQWLASLETTSPQLAAELRELIEEHAALNAAGFLEVSPTERIRNEPLLGRQIGAYRVEHMLSRGGMGEVWLAARVDGRFEGRCAIKFLTLHFASPEARARFQREGRLLGRLEHANIARLIDAGETEEHQPYLVIEYVDGQRIDHFCEANQLGIRERVRLFIQAVAAIEFAHANLIVHRDLKPANVFVTRDGVVKLLDFGIAKLVATDESGEAALTRLEGAPLTPEYAAPEQFQGAAPSTATDIYQLGMLLFVLLTGEHPFRLAHTPAEHMQAALAGVASRASQLVRDSRRYRLLRGDLDSILAKALRREPADRYATAAALRDDLKRFLDSEPVLARRGAATYTLRKFLLRHRAATAIAGIAIIGLCAAATFSILEAQETARQRDEARAAARRADAQATFLSLMMSQIGESGQPIQLHQVLARGMEILEARYRDDPAFMVDEQIRIADRYGELGENERVRDVLAKAEAIARRESNPLLLARVQCAAVQSELGFGNLQSAIQRLDEGMRALADASGAMFFEMVDCRRAAAWIHDAQGRAGDGIADLEFAVTTLENNNATADRRYVPLLAHLGLWYGYAGDIKRSYEAQHKARVLYEHNGFKGTLSWVLLLHNEAATLETAGEFHGALELQSEVMRFDQTHGLDGCPPHPATRTQFARLLARVGRNAEAEHWYARAFECASRIGDVAAQKFAILGRANTLLALGKLAEAGTELDAFDALNRSKQTLNMRITVRSKIVRSYWLAKRGELAAARELSAPLLELTGNPQLGLALSHDDVLLLRSRLALPDDPAAAEHYAEEALHVAESRARKAEDSAEVGEAALVLAQARFSSGDNALAHDAAVRAENILDTTLATDHTLTHTARALILQIENSKP
jgi:serine/threonine-protein kinase